ncbi:MAG: DUF948 domain-containing protein [Candidatus Aminicenantales bacterium]
MPLTLNQVLVLIISIVSVVALAFLIRLFIQLRQTAMEAERTLAEIGKLAKDLRELDQLVKEKIGELSQTIEASKKAAAHISEASLLVTTKILKPSSNYLPLLMPIARFFWRQWKKRKEKKHGK